MRLALVAALLASATAAADAPDWHDWKRLGDAGDRALASGQPALAEAKYRQALAMGDGLRQGADVDPHVSRLAAALAAQGRCDAPEGAGHALRGFLALARADLKTASAELQLALDEGDHTANCRATVVPEVLALLRWLDGRDAEARALLSAAAKTRCKALQTDPLDEAASALNGAWTSGDEKRWKKALAVAKRKLGPNHPLPALVLAKKQGQAAPKGPFCRPPPAPAPNGP